MQVKREKNHNIFSGISAAMSVKSQSIKIPRSKSGEFHMRLGLLLHRSLVLSGSQQSADGQGDLFLLLIDGSDLGIDDLALRENILGLLNAAVSDLGEHRDRR